MAVAKSYENLQIVGEPYSYSNDPKKKFVKVKGACKRCGGTGRYSYNPKDGDVCLGCRGAGTTILEVRWYTDAQRAAMDRAAEKRTAAKEVKKEERRVKFAARNAFGFGEAGYIQLVAGDKNVINDWAHETNPCRARYNTLFGWFIPSHLTVESVPEGVKLITLNWDKVRDETDPEDLSIKSDEEVTTIINELLGNMKGSISTFQGEVGEWIIKNITVKQNIKLDNAYGGSHMHIMEDEDGNEYVWTTSSKNISEGTNCVLKMKVKDHKEYKGVQQTIVFYCKEMK